MSVDLDPRDPDQEYAHRAMRAVSKEFADEDVKPNLVMIFERDPGSGVGVFGLSEDFTEAIRMIFLGLGAAYESSPQALQEDIRDNLNRVLALISDGD